MKYTIELTENQKKQMDFMLYMANKHMGFNRKLEMIETTNVEDTNEYQIGYKVGYNEGLTKQSDPHFVPLQKCPVRLEDCRAYKLGLDDASNLIAFVSKDFIQECFPNEYDWDLFDLNAKYGLAVVIEEFKKWQEEKKKAEEEIIKGDTVCFKSSPNITFIVWDILDEGDEGILLYGFNQDGTYSSVNIKNVKKVNVPNCYSEVSQLLDKLRGEE